MADERVWLVDPGGQVPAYCRSLAAALRRAGCVVTLLGAPSAPAAAGATSAPAFGRLLWLAGRPPGSRRRAWLRRALRAAPYPLELAALARRAQRERPDVLHLQWSVAPPLDALALRAVAAAGVRTVLTVHNVLPHEERPYQRYLLPVLWRSAQRLVVHSHATADRLRTVGGARADRMTVVPMGADPPPHGLPGRTEARRALGLSPAARVVLFFGHVRPYKGLDVLLDALPAVLSAVPGTTLLVAGRVPGGPAAARRLAARGSGRVPEEALLWRLGLRAADEVPLLFAAADVVALPYLATDDSAVLAQALAHGRPVVASRVGGLPEALARGGGLVVPPGHPRALAGALGAVLGNGALAARLEAEAAAAAAAWTWDDAARATRGVYARAGWAPDAGVGVRASRLGVGTRPASGAAGVGRRDRPPVSVILPARNEGAHLAAVLSALLAGDYPSDRLEVLVIDGRSSDGTPAVARAFARQDARVRLLDNPARLTPAALNTGLAAAGGDVIVRLDGHALPDPDYVRSCVAALERTGAWAVGGLMVGLGRTDFGRAVAAAGASRLGSGGAAYRSGGAGPVDTVYLGAWPRWVFDRVGPFQPSLAANQDYELCLRIRRAGGTVWLDPAIRTRTVTRGRPRALARQYYGYGGGRAATWRLHPQSLLPRQALPALMPAVATGALVVAPWSAAGRHALAAGAAAYAAAVAMASVRAGRDLPPAARPWLPLVYPLMHAAWGLGFWVELLGAARRGRRG